MTPFLFLGFLLSLVGIPSIIFADKSKSYSDDLLNYLNIKTDILEDVQIAYYVVIITSMVNSLACLLSILHKKKLLISYKVRCISLSIIQWLVVVSDVAVCLLLTAWLTELVTAYYVTHRTLDIYEVTYRAFGDVKQEVGNIVGNLTDKVAKLEPYLSKLPIQLPVDISTIDDYLNKINSTVNSDSVCPPYCLDLSVIGEFVISERCICAVESIQTIQEFASRGYTNLIISLSLCFTLFIATMTQLVFTSMKIFDQVESTIHPSATDDHPTESEKTTISYDKAEFMRKSYNIDIESHPTCEVRPWVQESTTVQVSDVAVPCKDLPRTYSNQIPTNNIGYARQTSS
jgi:hypothetical protein